MDKDTQCKATEQASARYQLPARNGGMARIKIQGDAQSKTRRSPVAFFLIARHLLVEPGCVMDGSACLSIQMNIRPPDQDIHNYTGGSRRKSIRSDMPHGEFFSEELGWDSFRAPPMPGSVRTSSPFIMSRRRTCGGDFYCWSPEAELHVKRFTRPDSCGVPEPWPGNRRKGWLR